MVPWYLYFFFIFDHVRGRKSAETTNIPNEGSVIKVSVFSLFQGLLSYTYFFKNTCQLYSSPLNMCQGCQSYIRYRFLIKLRSLRVITGSLLNICNRQTRVHPVQIRYFFFFLYCSKYVLDTIYHTCNNQIIWCAERQFT